jgi:hypothetical protein
LGDLKNIIGSLDYPDLKEDEIDFWIFPEISILMMDIEVIMDIILVFEYFSIFFV